MFHVKTSTTDKQNELISIQISAKCQKLQINQLQSNFLQTTHNRKQPVSIQFLCNKMISIRIFSKNAEGSK